MDGGKFVVADPRQWKPQTEPPTLPLSPDPSLGGVTWYEDYSGSIYPGYGTFYDVVAANIDKVLLDAPVDGSTYGRKNAAWVPVASQVVSGATAPPLADNQFWFDSASLSLFIAYNDGNSVQWVPTIVAPPGEQGPQGLMGPPGPTGPMGPMGPGGVGEAPIDSNTYGRSGAAWTQVLPLSGGTLTGPLNYTGGTINGAVIGGTTPAAGTFTNLTASGTVSGTGFTSLLAPYALSSGVPVASITNPIMDGTVAIGVGTTWARADHVHPSDTSRLSLSGGTLTGPLTLAGNAASNLQPVTLQQQTAALGNYLPLTGGTVTGPLNLIATGTTASRSEQDRWGATLNVKDFGAVGDGVANDTAAVQAAVAAVPSIGGNVYMPRGTYLVSSAILLKANTWLRGDGMQATIIKMANATNVSGLISNANIGDAYISLSDFTLDGNKANNGSGASQGILLTQISNITARSIEVQNVNGHGFVVSGNGVNTTRGGHFSRIYVHNCDIYGFVVTYAFRQATIDGLRVTNSGSVGNPTFHAVFLDASELIADNILADSNVNHGIHIHNVFGCTYNNLVATRNGGHGIFVEAMVRSVGANWRAQSNGTLTSNTYDDIHFANSNLGYGITANCEVSGIVVGPDSNFGSTQERYGLYIEDNVNSNIRLNDISYVGACLTGNVRPPATIGTLVIDDVLLKPNISGMFTATAAATVSGSGTFSLISTAGPGSHTISANSAKVGSRYRIKSVGYYNTPAAASNLTLAVVLGGTTLASATVAATQSIANGYFEAEAEITVRAIGAGGTVVAAARAMLYTAVGAVQTATWVTTGGPVAVNLSVDAVLDLTGSWAAPTTHSITGQQSWMEAIGPGG